MMNIPRQQRIKLAQFRLGVFPTRIETGHYLNETIEERLCTLCNNNKVEDECHVLTRCPLHTYERKVLYGKIQNGMPMFNILDNEEKLVVIMSDYPRQAARYLNNIYYKRRNIIFNCT